MWRVLKYNLNAPIQNCKHSGHLGIQGAIQKFSDWCHNWPNTYHYTSWLLSPSEIFSHMSVPVPVFFHRSKIFWKSTSVKVSKGWYTLANQTVHVQFVNGSCTKCMYMWTKLRCTDCIQLGAAHTSETNCLKHVAWNMKCLYDATNQYIFQWNSAHYETRNICFLKYTSWNLWIMSLRKCCATSDVEMERSRQIVWNTFP